MVEVAGESAAAAADRGYQDVVDIAVVAVVVVAAATAAAATAAAAVERG